MPTLLQPQSRPELEQINSTAGLETIRAEWDRLCARCPTATPFQSAAWLLSWWKHLGSGQLSVLVLRTGDRICGLVPLFLRSAQRGRTLTLLGIGNSDYLDALCEWGAEELLANAFTGHLENTRELWDICDLHQLRPESPLLKCPIPSDWSDQISAHETCPSLAFADRVEHLADCVPSRMLQNFRYARRRLERLGARIRLADHTTLQRDLCALFDLHSARWSARGEPGVLADSATQEFHLSAAAALLDQGALRLYTLHCAGQMIAVHYGFTQQSRSYFYLGGFDPAWERYSPGTVLIGHAIETSVHEGARAFDFLRGREDYKYNWGARDCFTFRRCITRGSTAPA